MRFAATIVLALALVSEHAGASCISVTAQQTAASIGAIPANAIVAVSPLESDIAPLPARANDLVVRMAQLIAGKIPGAHALARPMTLEQARAAASRAAGLVYVHVQLERSQLKVTADAYPVIRNVWDRARLPPPPPTAHAYAAAPIDAEVRGFFPPLPLDLQTIHKASHAEGEVIAAACGDLDGSGPSLMLVSRDRVAVGRIRAAKFEVERSIAWSALAKRVPVPLREPLGGAEVALGHAFAGTSDRGGVSFDDAFGSIRATASGIPIGAATCASISFARSAFDGTSPCDSLAGTSSAPSFDAASAFGLVAPVGTESLALATREGNKLHLRVGGVEKASFEGAGAQVTVLDADLDGTPEVAFSSDAESDVITIATAGEHGTRIVNRIAAPAGVRALAACPPLDSGTAAVVAVVGNEVWIVR